MSIAAVIVGLAASSACVAAPLGAPPLWPAVGPALVLVAFGLRRRSDLAAFGFAAPLYLFGLVFEIYGFSISPSRPKSAIDAIAAASCAAATALLIAASVVRLRSEPKASRGALLLGVLAGIAYFGLVSWLILGRVDLSPLSGHGVRGAADAGYSGRYVIS